MSTYALTQSHREVGAVHSFQAHHSCHFVYPADGLQMLETPLAQQDPEIAEIMVRDNQAHALLSAKWSFSSEKRSSANANPSS